MPPQVQNIAGAFFKQVGDYTQTVNKTNMLEKDFRKKVETRLEKFFNLYYEQKGYLLTPDGKKSLKRVDLIIEHKDNNSIVFGIEFKHNDKKRGYDLAKCCKQMMQYSFIEWNYKNNAKPFGVIPIIACPHISSNYLQFIRGHQHPEEHDHNNVNSFLSEAFNIGEVRPKDINGKRYMRICFANKVIWREFDYDLDIADPAAYHGLRKQTSKFVSNDIHPSNYQAIVKNIKKYRLQNYGT